MNFSPSTCSGYLCLIVQIERDGNVKFLSDTKSDFNESVDNFSCNLNDWIFT